MAEQKKVTTEGANAESAKKPVNSVNSVEKTESAKGETREGANAESNNDIAEKVIKEVLNGVEKMFQDFVKSSNFKAAPVLKSENLVFKPKEKQKKETINH
jgi:hypothetical protein